MARGRAFVIGGLKRQDAKDARALRMSCDRNFPAVTAAGPDGDWSRSGSGLRIWIWTPNLDLDLDLDSRSDLTLASLASWRFNPQATRDLPPASSPMPERPPRLGGSTLRPAHKSAERRGI